LTQERKLTTMRARAKPKRVELTDLNQIYVPHAMQELFHRCRSKGRLFYGANQSGKTRAGTNEALWWATGRHPYLRVPVPSFGWIISEDFSQSRAAITGLGGDEKFAEFTLWLRNYPGVVKKIDKQTKTVVFNNGSVIEFKSCDSGWEKFQGAKLNWAWFDEVPDESVFEEVTEMRLLSRKGSWWMTATAVLGEACWTNASIWERRGDPVGVVANKAGNPAMYFNKDLDRTLINPSIYDNLNPFSGASNINEDELRKRENSLGKASRAIRLDGMPSRREGLVFGDVWSPSEHLVHPFPIPSHWLIVYAIDFGFSTGHPFVAEFMAIAPDGKKYLFDEFSATGMDAGQCSVPVKEKVAGKEVYDILRDPKGGDRAVTLEMHGIYGRPWSDDPMARYEKIHEELSRRDANGKPMFYVFAGKCPRFVWEMGKFAWPKQGKGSLPSAKPRLINNDACDCTGGMLLENYSLPDEIEAQRPLGKDEYWEWREAQNRKKLIDDLVKNAKEFDGNVLRSIEIAEMEEMSCFF
jgi:phage terminase large subunit-like protein